MCRFFFFAVVSCFILSCQSDIFFASKSHQVDSAPEASLTPQRKLFLQKSESPQINLDLEKSPQKIIKEQLLEEFFAENSQTPVKLPAEYRQYVLTLKAQQKRTVDFLIVEDVSGSMNSYLKELGQRLSSLLVSISDYDWQMGFTTADHGDHPSDEEKKTEVLLQAARWQDHVEDPWASFGKLMLLEESPGNLVNLDGVNQNILTPHIPNYQDVFRHTVSHLPVKDCEFPPHCHSGRIEQPLKVLKSAMERVDFDNEALFRPHADLVSLIIINEDEHDDSEKATSAEEVVETFNTHLKPLGKRFFCF